MEERVVQMENGQLYQLFEQLVITKRNQRMIEERLLQSLGKPVHRKWMHERVQDQYKHEKMICDIVEGYLGRTMEIGPMRGKTTMGNSISHELNLRLDGIVHNIQLINGIGQLVEDFKIYKMITSMLSDEYIYNVRLVKILTEK